MGNVLLGEGYDTIYSYKSIPNLGLKVMVTSIGGVQQIRSQQLNQIKKIACILSDEEQANMRAKEIIQQANLEADDYDELE